MQPNFPQAEYRNAPTSQISSGNSTPRDSLLPRVPYAHENVWYERHNSAVYELSEIARTCVLPSCRTRQQCVQIYLGKYLGKAHKRLASLYASSMARRAAARLQLLRVAMSSFAFCPDMTYSGVFWRTRQCGHQSAVGQLFVVLPPTPDKIIWGPTCPVPRTVHLLREDITESICVLMCRLWRRGGHVGMLYSTGWRRVIGRNHRRSSGRTTGACHTDTTCRTISVV